MLSMPKISFQSSNIQDFSNIFTGIHSESIWEILDFWSLERKFRQEISGIFEGTYSMILSEFSVKFPYKFPDKFHSEILPGIHAGIFPMIPLGGISKKKPLDASSFFLQKLLN